MTKFYDHTNYPQQGAYGSSESMRAELETIEAGFDLVDTTKANQDDLSALEARVTAIETFGGGSGSGGSGGSGSYQPLSVLLTSIANLTVGADKMLYATSDSSFATATVTAYARALLDDADGVTMRQTLGLTIGANVQGYNDRLNSLANMSGVVSNTMPYFTAENVAAVTPITAFARTLLDDADATTMRETLGIVDSLNSNTALNAISNLTPAADRVPYFNGATTAGLAVLSAFGRSLIGSANAATGRAVLGLGSMATENSSSYATTGYVSSALSGYVTSGAMYTELNNYVTSATLSATLGGYASASHTHSGYASTSHTHSEYAAASHTHSGYATTAQVNAKANKGANSDITSLSGLNTSQYWGGVFGAHLGDTTTRNNSSNYIGMTNRGNTNAASYLFARVYKEGSTTNYWQTSLNQGSNGNAYLKTTGDILTFYTTEATVSGFRINSLVPEFRAIPSSVVGSVFRMFGLNNSNAWDCYASKETTPSFSINNSSGVGVRLSWGANSWTALSDMRLKTKDHDIVNALAVMGKITPFVGKYKNDTTERLRPFYSAQEVEAAGWNYPVFASESGELSLSYEGMIPLIHAGVIELHEKYRQQENEIATLRKALSEIKLQVASL